jgi:DtxR family Mn-dependent transcriptional regulator
MPTATLEEYLEAIYRLSEKGPVKPSQIAEAMNVSGPTVTATLGRLHQRGLVVREGTDVVLSDEGHVLAMDILRRHRLAERFLVDVLGMEWQSAHEDACLLEHALSPRVLAALEQFLDNPSSCPHGHAIPSASGDLAPAQGTPLTNVALETVSTIVRLDDEDEAVLAYLGELGAFPGAEIVVTAEAPFGGPLLVQIDGRPTALALDIAGKIVVTQSG